MDQKVKCIVVEDQAPAQRILKSYISDVPTLELVKVFNNALEAIPFLQNNEVDLLFLDIHLPKLSGMEFLKSLHTSPDVILTTAFSDYAVESYEYNVVDYLLKPFSFPRFLQAVNKVVEKQNELKDSSDDDIPQSVIIKSGHDLLKVSVEEIQYIHSDHDYTEVVTEGKTHLSNHTLKHWLEELNPQFVQIHKSYLVNRAFAESISQNQIRLANGKELPIGRAFKDGLRDRLGWM